jgi:hypothetical protein
MNAVSVVDGKCSGCGHVYASGFKYLAYRPGTIVGSLEHRPVASEVVELGQEGGPGFRRRVTSRRDAYPGRAVEDVVAAAHTRSSRRT